MYDRGSPMGKKPERLPGGRNFFTDIRHDKSMYIRKYKRTIVVK